MAKSEAIQSTIGITLFIIAAVLIVLYNIYSVDTYAIAAGLLIMGGIILVVRNREVLVNLLHNPKKMTPKERRERKLAKEKKERREWRNPIILNVFLSILASFLAFVVAGFGATFYGASNLVIIFIVAGVLSVIFIIFIWKFDSIPSKKSLLQR